MLIRLYELCSLADWPELYSKAYTPISADTGTIHCLAKCLTPSLHPNTPSLHPISHKVCTLSHTKFAPFLTPSLHPIYLQVCTVSHRKFAPYFTPSLHPNLLQVCTLSHSRVSPYLTPSLPPISLQFCTWFALWTAESAEMCPQLCWILTSLL